MTDHDSRLEVDRIVVGKDAEGNITADETVWIERTPKWHNIILKEYNGDEMDIIVDIDVPWQYPILADMLEQSMAFGIMMGVLRPA